MSKYYRSNRARFSNLANTASFSKTSAVGLGSLAIGGLGGAYLADKHTRRFTEDEDEKRELAKRAIPAVAGGLLGAWGAGTIFATSQLARYEDPNAYKKQLYAERYNPRLYQYTGAK